MTTSSADSPRYLLDGEPVTLAEFLKTNDFEPEEVAEISALPPGRTMRLGGGAAPVFTLTRLAPELGVVVNRGDGNLTCPCGNTTFSSGFDSCDAVGKSCEPTEADGWKGHVRCVECRRYFLATVSESLSIEPPALDVVVGYGDEP